MSRTRPGRIAAYAIATIAAGGVAALVAGSRRWTADTNALIEKLQSGSPAGHGGLLAFPPQQLIDLPPPVARYLSFAIEAGQPAITHARLQHAGDFAASPGKWAPFTSTQFSRVHAPGFVWDARVRIAPGVTIRVRDSYADGSGAMLAKVAGLYTVANSRNTPEMASGALARFLAEAAWMPTALAPGDAGAGVTWTPVDDSTATASLTDGSTSVSLDFHFAPDGPIERVSGLRYRDVAGRGVLTRWEGRFSEYVRRHDMMVPASGEVAWLRPDGRYPYWRGRVTDITFVTDPHRDPGGVSK